MHPWSDPGAKKSRYNEEEWRKEEAEPIADDESRCEES